MTDSMIADARKMRDGGMPYQKIADVIGLASGGTVWNHLHPTVAKQYQVKYSTNHAEKKRQDAARYYRDNREKVLQEARERYINDADYAEKKRQHAAKHYADHREDHIKKSVEWGHAHPTARKAITARYYQTHKEKYRLSCIKHRRNHPEAGASACAMRRALIAGSAIVATATQLAEIKEIYRRAKEDPKVRCYLCGHSIPLGHRHVDHITPISKGGQHRPSNVAVACDHCNISKNAKMPNAVGLLI